MYIREGRRWPTLSFTMRPREEVKSAGTGRREVGGGGEVTEYEGSFE